MTEPVPPSTDEPLPGMADPSPTAYGATVLQVQVARSLRFMAEQGMVDERHAGLMELALQLAGAIRPSERAYGNAQAAAQLLATFAQLMPAQEGGTDGFAELRAYLAGVEASGSASPVRDTP